MNDREAFERAIRLNPQDEAPRLIYADWLEDHDEPELSAAMRRTTSEGQTALGLMSWRDWDRWCLHLVPDALECITLDWSEVLIGVEVLQCYMIKLRPFWAFEINLNHLRCNGSVFDLLQKVDTKVSAITTPDNPGKGKSITVWGATISPDEYLSLAALEWSRRKAKNPELVGVVDFDISEAVNAMGMAMRVAGDAVVRVSGTISNAISGLANYVQEHHPELIEHNNETHDTETVG